MRQSVGQRLAHLADEWGPRLRRAVEEGVSQARERLDRLNCSLADKALPEDRKTRIGRLELERKAKLAGQGKRAKKAPKSPAKAGARKQKA
ncbi:MAG: hypothetical protein R3280_03235 [Marinobacter sp.]|uniref:hypothetical protein n=1 Tax=Marinobacter sp. TaxID=50741 RepID=UPI00299DD63D|nr:hypothetical protein [Marinobacter sp.]MDX1633625.1 hypothetical protein [Marinobacter sp.]